MVAPVAKTAPRAALSCRIHPAGQAPSSRPTDQGEEARTVAALGAAAAAAGDTPVGEVEAIPVAAVADTPAVGEVEPSPVAAEAHRLVAPAQVAVEVVAGTTNPEAHCIC